MCGRFSISCICDCVSLHLLGFNPPPHTHTQLSTIRNFKEYQNFRWTRVDDNEVRMEYSAYCTRGEKHETTEFAPLDVDELALRPKLAARPWAEASDVFGNYIDRLATELRVQNVSPDSIEAYKEAWEETMDTLDASVARLQTAVHAKLPTARNGVAAEEKTDDETALGSVHTADELAFAPEPVSHIVHENNRLEQTRLNRQAVADSTEEAKLQEQSRQQVFDELEVGEVVAVKIARDTGWWKFVWGLAVVCECVGDSRMMSSKLKIAWLVEMDPKQWPSTATSEALSAIRWTFVPGDSTAAHSQRMRVKLLFPQVRMPIVLQKDANEISRACVFFALGKEPLTHARYLKKTVRIPLDAAAAAL
jgi:hypothetical protein